MAKVPAQVTAPDHTSSDYDAMKPYWEQIATMNDGTGSMRAAGELYLPKFEAESSERYEERRKNAVFTNIYSDIVENLADKPFAKEVSIVDGSERVKAYSEDIDGQGNNLHNFAATYFRNAIDNGVDWIYVDFTKINPNVVDANGNTRRRSVAEERAAGARPYWVRVSALEMIAVYSAVINGEEDFVHCRMIETFKERAGWDEIDVVQVRELNREPLLDEEGNVTDWLPATYRIWQQREQSATQRRNTPKRMVWTVIEEGDVAIGIIPIVPLVIGERKGNSWRLIPALRKVADMQLEYYEQENGLKNIKKFTAFPILSAAGVEPEKGSDGEPKRAKVGPSAVLYAPVTEAGAGSWGFVEPAGTSLTFLRGELQEMAKEMRELGRQPLTQSSGTLTTSTSDMAASKGQSAVQRWALLLKDAIENALFLTALWINDATEPTVNISADFSTGEAEDNGFEHVLKLREGGDLSQETIWEEASRRKILGDEFDPEEEKTRLEAEEPSDEELESTLPGEEEDETTSPDDE